MKNDGFVEALKALAHPVRWRIMQALAGSERNVGEIDQLADIGQPTLSQQLAVLRNAGLVTTRKAAKLVYYRPHEARLAELATALGGMVGAIGDFEEPQRKPASGAANFARMT